MTNDNQLLPERKILNATDAAKFLGISKSKLYKLTMKKEIPFYKPFGEKPVLFDTEELVEWLKTFRVPTMAEIEEQSTKLFKAHNNNGN